MIGIWNRRIFSNIWNRNFFEEIFFQFKFFKVWNRKLCQRENIAHSGIVCKDIAQRDIVQTNREGWEVEGKKFLKLWIERWLYQRERLLERTLSREFFFKSHNSINQMIWSHIRYVTQPFLIVVYGRLDFFKVQWKVQNILKRKIGEKF